MISEDGCVQLTVDSYWFYLGAMKYVLALVGLVGGVLSTVAGRLLLRYVLFCSVTGAVVAISNYVAYQCFDGLDDIKNSAYWICLGVSSVIGLLLGWLSTRY